MKMDETKNCCNIDFNEIERLRKVLSNLYDDEKLYGRSEIFKALSDTTRLQILFLLKFRDFVCL